MKKIPTFKVKTDEGKIIELIRVDDVEEFISQQFEVKKDSNSLSKVLSGNTKPCDKGDKYLERSASQMVDNQLPADNLRRYIG